MLAALLVAALGLQPLRPSLPVFDGGPATNLALDCDACMTNASAHVAWAIALPLAGERIGGRRGLWVAGLGWMGLTLVTETLFHAPPGTLGPAYASEVRTDLLTRLVPCASILLFDLLRSHP